MDYPMQNNDPLLYGRFQSGQYMSDAINQEIGRLNALKQQYNQPLPRQNAINTPWEEIDREVLSLTVEQQKILAQDETYVAIDRELQIMIQQELIDSVKYKVGNTPRGKELLEKQLSNIRNKKEQIISQSNKEMELFKQFQVAVQANPNLTYAEFVKTIQN